MSRGTESLFQEVFPLNPKVDGNKLFFTFSIRDGFDTQHNDLTAKEGETGVKPREVVKPLLHTPSRDRNRIVLKIIIIRL